MIISQIFYNRRCLSMPNEPFLTKLDALPGQVPQSTNAHTESTTIIHQNNDKVATLQSSKINNKAKTKRKQTKQSITEYYIGDIDKPDIEKDAKPIYYSHIIQIRTTNDKNRTNYHYSSPGVSVLRFFSYGALSLPRGLQFLSRECQLHLQAGLSIPSVVFGSVSIIISDYPRIDMKSVILLISGNILLLKLLHASQMNHQLP